MTLIEVHGLHKAFGEHQVLRGIDFTAREGTATALLGPSGSGKMTEKRSGKAERDPAPSKPGTQGREPSEE